jgi:gliding motility-associated-like protein
MATPLKLILSLIIYFISNYAFAQPNLVRNGSFEMVSNNCTVAYSGGRISKCFDNWIGNAWALNTCANDTLILDWLGRIYPTFGVPKNECGEQNTHSGNGYIVISFLDLNSPLDDRKYVETRLKEKLIPRLKYEGKYFVSATEIIVGNGSKYFRISALGMFLGKEAFVLSDTGVYYKDPGTVAKYSPPQIENDLNTPLADTVNWMEIKGSFEAKGNEEYLSLGCFNYEKNTKIFNIYNYYLDWGNAPYYVDDVSLIPQNTFHRYDSSICYPTKLSAAAGSKGFEWFDGDTIHETRTFNDTGVYWVKSYFYDRSVYMVDTFHLIPSPYLASTLDKDVFVICENTSIELKSNPKVTCNYLWSNGSSSASSNYSWNTNGAQWVQMFTGDCKRTDSFFIDYIKEPELFVTHDTSVCLGNALKINAITKVPVTYTWSSGDTNQLGILPDTGIWMIQVRDKQSSCINTDTIYVRAKPPISVIASSDTLVCFDEVNSILLWAGTYKSYLWEPTGETNSKIQAYESKIYKLSVIDSNNCKGEKYIEVLEKCKPQIFIPSAFTPNGDGINDEFLIPLSARNLELYELKIYNRWGIEVFSSQNYLESWSGKNNTTDTYSYKLLVKYKNNTAEYLSGTIDLIR